MGATDTVYALDDSLTDQQKAKLTKVLVKRRGELQRAIKDVDAAINKLKKGKKGKKSAKRKRRSY
jgi:Skp family chaperone for outer membrane proteins